MSSEFEETCKADSLKTTTFTYIYFGTYFGVLFAFSLWAAHNLVDLKSIRRNKHNRAESSENEATVMTVMASQESSVAVSNKSLSLGDASQDIDSVDVTVAMANVTNNTQTSLKKKFKKFGIKWLKSIKHFKSCYFVTINHTFDQVTDIAVILEFIQLYQFEQKYNNKISDDFDYCPGVNPGILAACSIFALLLYRIVSAVSIYRVTNDWKRIFLQLLDLELFRAMYVNYAVNSTNPCNPQRWINTTIIDSIIFCNKITSL